MGNIWCHPLFASLLTLLLHHHPCAGRELHDALSSASTGYLQNSKMLPLHGTQPADNSTEMRSNAQKPVFMNTEEVEQLEVEVASLRQALVLENASQEKIRIKLRAIHAAVLDTDVTQVTESVMHIRMYYDLNKNRRKWKRTEDSLKKTEDDLRRIPPTFPGVGLLQDHVHEVRTNLKLRKDSEERLLASIDETVNAYWLKRAMVLVTVTRDNCVRLFDMMDAEKSKIEDLLKMVNPEMALDSSNVGPKQEKELDSWTVVPQLETALDSSRVASLQAKALADAKKTLQEYVKKFDENLEYLKTKIDHTQGFVNESPTPSIRQELQPFVSTLQAKLAMHEKLMASVKKAIGVGDAGKH